MITVIFDTETTGLLKPSAQGIETQPHITEIFCLKVHEGDAFEVPGGFQIIDEFDQMFKVPVPLSDIITKITGLTDEMLEDQPTFGQKQKELAEFFTGVDRIVAHNLAFDLSMLANEMVRCNKLLKFPWPVDHVCTVERTLHIEQRRMSLTRLHENLFGEGFPDAHRAKNDVVPLYRCYKKLVIDGVIK